MTQLSIITSVTPAEIAREKTLGGAIELCAKAAGYAYDKELQDALEQKGMHVDKGQLSRWQNGGEGILWPKLEAYMDALGNDAPVLWMLYQRGADLTSLRKRETEMERRWREEHEARLKAEEENRILRGLITNRAAA
jgi:hypothetical protein